MNIYFISIAFALALVFFMLAKKFEWEKTLIYNYLFLGIGIIGLIFLVYMLSINFNYTYLLINILLAIGLIPKVINIIKIRKGKKD
jgi:hypothetical protein